MAHTVHTLLVAALLVPFVALAVCVIALSFGVAWKASKR